ncbi:MAG: OmpA family protein [Chitinophagales bacterium]|nr:OmpA family protein [Bacteroidota bacterium]
MNLKKIIYFGVIGLFFSFNSLNAQKLFEADVRKIDPLPFNTSQVNDIALENGYRLWVATNKGVACFSENGATQYFVDSLQHDKFNANVILVDDYNHKWIGLNNGQLLKISNFSAQTYQRFDYLTVPVNSIAATKQTVWVGSKQGNIIGVDIASQEKNDIETIYNGPVNALFADDEKLVLVGRGDGLFRSGRNYKITNWLEYAQIAEVFDIKRVGKEFWLIGRDSNNNPVLLSSYDLEGWEKVDMNCLQQQQGKQLKFNDFEWDNQQNIWIATSNGIIKYATSDKNCTYYSTQNTEKFPLQDVISIAPKNDSIVWLASDNRGLFQVTLRKLLSPEDTLLLAEERASIKRKKALLSKSDLVCNDTLELSKLIFRANSTNFLEPDQAEGNLDIIVEYLNENPNASIELYGHTNNLSDNTDFLMNLSEQRVEAVKKYLSSNGVKSKRIETYSFGGTKPIITEGSSALREKNRRVEVMIKCP